MTEDTPASGGFGVGSRLASYRLDEEIGRGGMAVVYRAYDTRLERPVALKVLAPQLAEDEGFRQRFIRESRTAAAVDHPNIIPIFEAGEAGGVLFIAMRFVHGPDVQTLIAAEGPLSAARTCHIITQVAGALEAAHAHGLVHRDVKPGNILLDASAGPDLPGHAYLSDFGLSKRALSSSALTSTGQFLGTVDYIAPEQIEARAVDGRTDEYALACSVYTMLTGQPPFVRDESIAVMWAQVSAAPPSITSRRPDLPAAVDDVLAKALSKSRTDRYGTCPQFAAALRRACGLAPAGLAAEAGPAAGRPPARPAEPSAAPPGHGTLIASPGPGVPSGEGAPAGTGTPAGPGAPGGTGAPPGGRAPADGPAAQVPAAGGGDAALPGEPAAPPWIVREDEPAGPARPGDPGYPEPVAGEPPAGAGAGPAGQPPASPGGGPAEEAPPGPAAHAPPPELGAAAAGPEGHVPTSPGGNVPGGLGPAGGTGTPGPGPQHPSAGSPGDPGGDEGAMPGLATQEMILGQYGPGDQRLEPPARPGWPGRQPGGPGPGGPGGAPGSPGGPGRPTRPRRSRTRIAAGGVGLAALIIAGGFFMLLRGSGGGGAAVTHHRAPLTLPGCTQAVAHGPQLGQVPSQRAGVGGQPFDVAARPGFAFVTQTSGHLTVMSTKTSPPRTLWTVPVPGGSLGEAITPDQAHLVVTGGPGISVFRVADLERGPARPAGSLAAPGQKHAVEVVVTPDSRYALVTFQSTNTVGVFNLQRALSSGFGPADLVGLIPVGPVPIGIALSPDGRYAYVTSQPRGGPPNGPGVLNVIDVRTAEAHPASAVVKSVPAGCEPGRVITAGGQVWVAASGSNALLGFSAAKLLSQPGQALNARQAVGSVPLGLILVRNGTRIVIADSDRGNQAGTAANLAVVNVQAALARRPALTGYLASGQQPRQFALVPGGGTLLVTVTNSGQLQAVSLGHLP